MLTAIIAALLMGQPTEQVVRFANGDLAPGYVSGEGCVTEERCGEYVVEEATGQIVMFRDRWINGFFSTGRGQEIIKEIEPQPSGDGQ